MNRFVAGIAGLLLATFFMTTKSAAQTNTFKGEITDDQLNCLQTPMKSAGLNDKGNCVRYWVRYQQPAGKFVLYDAATKTAYKLDDQETAGEYIAEKVEVTGTLDSATKTIKVTGIKVNESAYKAGPRS